MCTIQREFITHTDNFQHHSYLFQECTIAHLYIIIMHTFIDGICPHYCTSMHTTIVFLVPAQYNGKNEFHYAIQILNCFAKGAEKIFHYHPSIARDSANVGRL